MTGQHPDTVDLDGTSHFITAVDGTGLFKPEEHGFRQRPMSSACWHDHALCKVTSASTARNLSSDHEAAGVVSRQWW